MSENTQIDKVQEPVSTRFMNMIIKEFTGSVGDVALTNFQKRLAQNYFIAIDGALAKAEQKRQAKRTNKDPLPVTWVNVDMKKLAPDVVAAARVGFDPAQPNHVSMVPYKNNASGNYGVGFIPGYRGLEMKAVKYGQSVPDAVIVELVHKNDTFLPIKKDFKHPVEGYEFEVSTPFDRGEIIGGFYYHLYADQPEKNKLVIFSVADILKRKPKYASPEFWGGEKDVWKDGKKTGKKEKVDGWYEKMCWKTIYRAAYNDITIDSQKIDDDYLRLKQMEDALSDQEVAAEIAENANGEVLDVEAETVENDDIPAENAEKVTENDQKATKQETLSGPGF